LRLQDENEFVLSVPPPVPDSSRPIEADPFLPPSHDSAPVDQPTFYARQCEGDIGGSVHVGAVGWAMIEKMLRYRSSVTSCWP
jgi:hypothetical protein